MPARRRDPADRRLAATLAIGVWLLVGLLAPTEQFQLQAAWLDVLTTEGRLHFEEGRFRDPWFLNEEAETERHRHLLNVFPFVDANDETTFHVNHAPGQVLLAAPWYLVARSLGWSFAEAPGAASAFLVWTLLAPLTGLSVAALFVLVRRAGAARGAAAVAAVLSLAGPLLPASTVLYHDSLATHLLAIAASLVLAAPANGTWRGAVQVAIGGLLLGWSVLTTYLVLPLAAALGLLLLLVADLTIRDRILYATTAVGTTLLVPLSNWLAYGSPLATGYSAGGFDSNYPTASPLNFARKLWFYLLDDAHGLLGLFPLFLLGALGLVLPALRRPWRLAIAGLAMLHLLFIATLGHYGSSGWGMGRFFLPLYPLLALGIVGIVTASPPYGRWLRAVGGAAFAVGLLHTAAAVRYGLTGMPEDPLGLVPMSARLDADYGALYPLALLVTAGVGFAVGVVHRPTREPDVAPTRSSP